MRFRYARDPLCLTACALYVLNRWVVQRLTAGAFWHSYADDLLLIPAALPLVLWVQRGLGLRTHDAFPGWGEIGLHLALWILAAEVVAPRLWAHSVADWRDALAYTAGAVVAGVWWGRRERQRGPGASGMPPGVR